MAEVEEVEKPVQERASDGSGKFAGKNSGHVAAFEAAHEKFVKTLEEAGSHGEGLVPDAARLKEKEQPEDADEAPEGKPEVVPDGADSSAIEAGLSALKRLKVPAKVIDGMTKGELAEYGKEAVRQAAEKDSLFREVGELRKTAAKSSAKGAESAKAEQPAIDLDAELQLVAETLDDDAGKAVGGLLKKLAANFSAENAKLREQLEAIQGSVQANQIAEVLEDEAKAGLAERFPQLKDRKFLRDKILPLMGKLNSDGEYTDANGNVDRNQLMLHAARVACEEAPAQAPQGRSKAANPITDTSSKVRSNGRPKTMSDVFDRAYDAAVVKDLPLDRVRAALR